MLDLFHNVSIVFSCLYIEKKVKQTLKKLRHKAIISLKITMKKICLNEIQMPKYFFIEFKITFALFLYLLSQFYSPIYLLLQTRMKIKKNNFKTLIVFHYARRYFTSYT